jgi:hypothetical protein
LLLRANGFLVANNTVVRTAGRRHPRVVRLKERRILNNVVRETGDDMIGVVSYTSSTRPISPATVLSSWNTRVDSYLVRNVLIAGNQLGGQYWGRGISVVGGQRITISRNTIDNVPLAAGVFVAREAGYQTFGVENVLIESNLIRNVQNMSPRTTIVTSSRQPRAPATAPSRSKPGCSKTRRPTPPFVNCVGAQRVDARQRRRSCHLQRCSSGREPRADGDPHRFQRPLGTTQCGRR